MVKTLGRKQRQPQPRKFLDAAARDVLRCLGDRAEPPIDLFALAHLQRVRKIHLRPMVGEGATYSVNGGFEIALRDNARDEIIRLDLDDPRRPPLALRQRFTLAHEIAHTLYYDLTSSRPVLMDHSPRGDTLEAFCNRAAGVFLLPDALLRDDLKETTVSLDSIRWLSSRYRASTAAVIRRIDDLNVGKTADHAVVYAQRRADEVDIVAAFVPPFLQVVLPRPKPYVTKLGSWGCSFVSRDFWASRMWRSEVDAYGMKLCVEKRSNERENAFYLDISAI